MQTPPYLQSTKPIEVEDHDDGIHLIFVKYFLSYYGTPKSTWFF